MYKRLTEVDGYKVFENYEKSANDLYNMYCEILIKDVDDIDVYKKAKILDNYYKEKNDKNQEKLMDLGRMIVNEYKAFNPGNEKYFFKSGMNPKRFIHKQFSNFFILVDQQHTQIPNVNH